MNNPELYAASPEYCHYYFDLVETDDLLAELVADGDKTLRFFKEIPVDKEHYVYQDGKWTVTQLLRHIIDCERIFAYRALRFGRFDETPLSGFDEDFYMAGLHNKKENLVDLIEEFSAVRNATVALYQTLNDTMLDFHGTANNLKVSARAIGFCVIGHNRHHQRIISERYL